MIDFFIELSTGVAAPISKEFLEVTNIKEIYKGNIDIQQWNGKLSGRYNFSVYKMEKT